MRTLITALAGVAGALLAYGALSVLFAEQRRVRRQLRLLDVYEAKEAAGAQPLLKPFTERVLAPLISTLSRAIRSFTPADIMERERARLRLAGEPGGLTPERWTAIRAISGLAVAVLAVLIATPGSVRAALLVGLIGLIVGVALPELWLKNRIEQRKLAIRRSMPDLLDLLTISVEAGMGFDAAVARVIRGRPGPLADEFARMLHEVQAGVARREALRNLAERTQVPELNTFITAIVQADVFGVSVSKVLRTQAREMRVKRRQLAEELAQKAPVKIVFPLVLCILPATIIVIAGPAVVRIAQVFGLAG